MIADEIGKSLKPKGEKIKKNEKGTSKNMEGPKGSYLE